MPGPPSWKASSRSASFHARSTARGSPPPAGCTVTLTAFGTRVPPAHWLRANGSRRGSFAVASVASKKVLPPPVTLTITSPSLSVLSPSIFCTLNAPFSAAVPARTAAICPIFIRRPVSWRKAGGRVTATASDGNSSGPDSFGTPCRSNRRTTSVTSDPASALNRRR